MKIGVLTSSRADYGIYQPLLLKLIADDRFDIEIIAFGMHLQAKQGNTIDAIREDGFAKIYTVGSMPQCDSIYDISFGYGSLVSEFALFWDKQYFDLIFALGDRWEMSAAVQASIPFELEIAHFYGGETTLGAIDDIYRHQITLASQVHFTATKVYSQRVMQIKGSENNIFNVGSISLEGLDNLSLPEWSKVKENFQISFDDFVLVTFHPESVGASNNKTYAEVIFTVLEELSSRLNILITGTNSDAMGSLFTSCFERLEGLYPNKIKMVTTLGRLNYFKTMQQCAFMLGNTSSGIVEAASFNKWVVNVGDRQKNRLRNENIIDVPFEVKEIMTAVKQVISRDVYLGGNIYAKLETTDTIIKIISEYARL